MIEFSFNYSDNPEALDAIYIISETQNNLFLTGSAGTGKSTLLREVVKNLKKKVLVVAPTGIAAYNVGGKTIHSIFQLEIGVVYTPQLKLTYNYKEEKIEIFKQLELLIIDEVSMLRADTLDYVDSILKRYRKNNLAFGGVQVLFVGDMHQLPPIVERSFKQEFYNHYESPFFFHSHIIQNIDLLTVKLKKVYRQRDDSFVSFLNKIRERDISDKELAVINNRVINLVDFDGIIITTKNNIVDEINTKRLNTLIGEARLFRANILGDVKDLKNVVDESLKLKVGARIMFIRNDSYNRWVNGTVGEVIKFSDRITVKLDNNSIVEVSKYTFENIDTYVNKKTGEITKTIKGTIEQFPLKLAWAITIHKSQGLTFDKVKIDLGTGAWDSGQVYTALSRCTSLENLYLQNPIRMKDIHLDDNVKLFSEKYNDEIVFRASLLAKKIRRSKIENLSNDSAVEERKKWAKENYSIADNILAKFEYLCTIIICEYLNGNRDELEQLIFESYKYKSLNKIFGEGIHVFHEYLISTNSEKLLETKNLKTIATNEFSVSPKLIEKIFRGL